jgi:5-deoxy-glucuronate isomerase
MKLHIKSPGEVPGVYPIAERGKQLKYLSFTILELGGKLKEHKLESGEEELSLDFCTGPVKVEVEGASGRWLTEIGPRSSLKEPGPMVYVPSESRVRIASLDGPARIIIAGAEGKKGAVPVLVQGDQIAKSSAGKDNWARTVYTHIARNVDAAHLICGQTVNQPGGWASCPPHRHDRFAEPEIPMQEIYYFQFEPRQGYGFMRVYTDPDDPEAFDYAYAVEHGDTVLIPRGYHPLVAGPGYTLNYTWMLAGEARTYGGWTEDPRHTWIKNP